MEERIKQASPLYSGRSGKRYGVLAVWDGSGSGSYFLLGVGCVYS